MAPVQAEARSTRDLMISAVNGWLLVYDNISSLPSWLSDSLCRLATGGGFATRTLYSNKEQSVIYAQRPIVLNGIDEFVRKADLADRGVFLHPPTIFDFQRREEKEFWRSFRQNQPGILGGLLDVIVGALREFPSVQLASLPRMADFARFGEAVGRGLGWPDGRFLSIYLNNRREATASKLEQSPLGTVLLELLEAHGGSLDWTMPPAEALYIFTKAADKKVAASPRLAENADGAREGTAMARASSPRARTIRHIQQKSQGTLHHLHDEAEVRLFQRHAIKTDGVEVCAGTKGFRIMRATRVSRCGTRPRHL